MSRTLFDQVTASRRQLLASQSGRFPRIVITGGQRYVLLRGVFSPEAFWSTRIFTSLLPFRSGQSFLEIGCGAGVTSVVAALQGASRVVAVDINRHAVENTALNGELHGVGDRLVAMRSNIFDALKVADRFDSIYWNTPFIWRPSTFRFRSQLERALFDPGYSLTSRFLRQAHARLAEGGRLFLGFADFGDTRRFMEITRHYGYRVDLLGTGVGHEGRRVTFQLFELISRRDKPRMDR